MVTSVNQVREVSSDRWLFDESVDLKSRLTMSTPKAGQRVTKRLVRRTSQRRVSKGYRRQSKSPSGLPKDFIPSAYFNEDFVICYIQLTSKLSKPVRESVVDMQTFVTAQVGYTPSHAKAKINSGMKARMKPFTQVKAESVDVFVMKERHEASHVMDTSRFTKVHDLLFSDVSKEGFLTFLKNEHCEELLMLLDRIDKTAQLSNFEEIEKSNDEIYKTFIESGAPMEVNLEPKLQNRLETQYNEPANRKSKVLFLPAKKELLNHLGFEFDRFRGSEDYYDLEMVAREKDVKKWRGNFQEIINDQVGRRVLLNFMISERNEENLLFFMAIEKMKKCHDLGEIKEHNLKIFDTFIGEDDSAIPEDLGNEPHTFVNIDWKLKGQITDALQKEPTSKTIYDKAEAAIIGSLIDESWPRFLQSNTLLVHQQNPKEKESTAKAESASSGQKTAAENSSTSSKKKQKGGLKGIFKKSK